MNKPWYPNLVGKVHPEAERAITSLYQEVQKIGPQVDQLQESLKTVTHPGMPSAWLHPEDLAKITHELSAAGSSPLNVGSLIGQLAQPQKAMVTINNFNGSPTTPGGTQPAQGQLVIQGGQLYYFDSTVTPGVYRPLSAQAVLLGDLYANWTTTKYDPTTLQAGTAIVITDWNVVYWVQGGAWIYLTGVFEAAYANLPVNGFNGVALGAHDKGLRFYDNTTFIRSWEWTGTAWKYVSGELPGGESGPPVVALVSPLATPSGWTPANGATLNVTKSDATLRSITLPTIAGSYVKL